ncbi:ATP-binding protein [Massilia sp. TWR1-2-2]|uniref:hybrid sensor histidine kinase/response regulator n=1 Tax=Massilia sp. TWR1-2-2 TaxID=2804584 RepID=UPI003CF119AC
MFSLTDGALLYVSAAYDAMWGRDGARLAEAPGDWIASVHADDRAALLQRWEGLREHGAYDEEYRVAQPDGAMRWVRDRAFVVKDAMDQPYRIARITSDISGRKAMESRLRAADENKNDFLATLAHELRNPLSPIRTAVELLGRAGPDAVSVQGKARAVIIRQVDHLTRLVDDLLDVARISEGKLTLRQEAVELDGVLKAALETATPGLQARHHAIEVTAPAQPLWVWGDAVRLAQSIGNLLHNAAKFTSPNGAVRLVVDVVADGMVHITVHDNGIGISAENLPRIFDMFAQGAFAPDRAHDGLGIGLSLVSTLVTMHGGRLTASSPGIGLGSAFTIALPLMPAPAAATPASAPSAAGLQGAGSALSILLVDDNVDSAEMMRDLLVALGHTVELAHDGASALALAALRTPNVMILDIGLPDMDGAELARRLRALPALAHTRLVAHTGYGAPHDREKTSEAGFDFHLVKPVAMADLQAALRAT